MLRVVFSMMQQAGDGRVGRAQISEIARSADMQAILRYTVFWLPLKRRQWTFFYGIFEDEAACITVDEWIRAAHGLAEREEVRVGQVRRDVQHKSIAEACSVTGDWSVHR
jgi:hypothetical protein